jgi:hypothetical protein
MKPKHYVINGVIAYIFFLITSVPATTIIRLFDEHIPQVNIQGINGTLWSGSAQRITLSSRYVIDDVSWSFCTWRLLTAEACINLDASYQNKPVQGQLGIGITGDLIARDLSIETDAQSLGDLARLPVGELSGLISIHLESVNWIQEHIPSAVGKIQWKNATITVVETASLGDVAITLTESDDFPLTAIISNKGGHITLSGETHISDDGSYNLELKLTPNNTTSKNLRASLEMFAEQQNDGSFVLQNTGNLKQFGIM